MLYHTLAFFVLSFAVSSYCKMTPTERYTHRATLRSGNIKLYWKFNNSTITFEVHGETNGWIGIGFSPNGAMTGADIIVGWVKDGVVRVTDRHGTANTFPPKDPEQNINVITGRECNGWTMFKFSRQIAACEKDYDREITSSTQRLIWAYGHDDPEGDDIEPTDYHGSKRGTESMYFLESANRPTSKLPDGPTYKTFDIVADKFNVPAEDTYYNCIMFKLPELKKKHHIVKFEPIIQEGNELNVHHIVVYQCADVIKNKEEIGTQQRCFSPNMSHFQTCRMVITVWAVGGGDLLYPDEAGYSLGASGDPIYVQLEIHYDNPFLKSDIVDSSGMRMVYTDTLRKYDVGVVEVGNTVFALQHFIPPNAESFLSVGVCPSTCIEKEMEKDNRTSVTMFSVLLHAHLAGKSLKLRHIRDGVELPYLASDETYDFNYQEARFLHPRVELKSTDDLRLECLYNTEGRSEVTEGGLGTPQEMCVAFISYYPKMDFSACLSSASLQELWPYFGISVHDFEYKTMYIEPSLKHYNVSVEGSSEVKTAYEAISEYDWTEEKVDKFAEAYVKMTQVVMCLPRNFSQMSIDNMPMPAIKSEYQPLVKNCTVPANPLRQAKAARRCFSGEMQSATQVASTTSSAAAHLSAMPLLYFAIFLSSLSF